MIDEATKLIDLAEEVRKKSLAREAATRPGDANVLILLGNWHRLTRWNAVAIARLCGAGDQAAETAARQVRGLLEIRTDVGYVLRSDEEVGARADVALASQMLRLKQLHESVLLARRNYDIRYWQEARSGFETALDTLDKAAVEQARKSLRGGHWSGRHRREVFVIAGLPAETNDTLWAQLSTEEHGMKVAVEHLHHEPDTSYVFFEMTADQAMECARLYCRTAAKMLSETHNLIAKYFDLPFVVNPLE